MNSILVPGDVMWSGKFPGLGEQTFLPNMWLEQASAITVLLTQEINAPNMPLLLKGKDSKRKEDVRKINIKPPKKTPLIQLQAVIWDRDWSAASRIHQVAPEVELRHISKNGECAWECDRQLHCPVSVPVLCWSRWSHNWATAWCRSLSMTHWQHWSPLTASKPVWVTVLSWQSSMQLCSKQGHSVPTGYTLQSKIFMWENIASTRSKLKESP